MSRQMSPKNPSLHDATPAGRLEEARLHHLIGYQAAQALIATTQVFIRQAGKPLDLRSVEYTVLTLINENPGSTSAQLAQALAVSAPNITAWIDRLEKRGLVERVPSKTDRRAQPLHTTRVGARLARQATQQLLDGEREAFAHLTEAERAMLIELLHKVARARPAKPKRTSSKRASG